MPLAAGAFQKWFLSFGKGLLQSFPVVSGGWCACCPSSAAGAENLVSGRVILRQTAWKAGV